MREALNRLSSESLVVVSDQRGFAVSGMSSDKLEELTRTRVWLNDVALRHSLQYGDDAWEETVVLAYHRLSRTPRFSSSGELNRDWNAPHRNFHAVLTAACKSSWLQTYCEQLFDQSERYRNLSRTIAPDLRSDGDEHRSIFEAALLRDQTLLVQLMTDHVRKTTDILLQNWDGIAKAAQDAA
jgi:DNA-binding GntR family transcriptional regulator